MEKCFLLVKTLYFYIKSKNGKLGLGDFKNRFSNTPKMLTSLNNITQISVSNFNSMALTSNGKVFSFGKNQVLFF